MEANLNKLLATVDRVFKIELMKMPQSLHTTLIKDLMNGTTVTQHVCPVWILLLMLFVLIICVCVFVIFLKMMTRLWARSQWH